MRIHRIVRPSCAALLGVVFGCLAVIFFSWRGSASRPVIAFIPRTSGTNLTEDMRRGAQAAAQSAGYRLYWNAPTREDDLDRQIEIAETVVHRGARALILGPSNPWGVVTMIDRLTNRKIPIVIVQAEVPISAGSHLTSVTPDQEQFGRLAAERIAQLTGGKGEVAIVGLGHGTPESLLRAQSFMRTIAAYPGIEIVAQTPGSVQIPEAEQSTRELVSKFPDLKAIFALTADATQGAMLVLEALNTPHSVALVGSDRDLFLALDLQEGKLDSLVAADGYQIGYLAVEAALDGIQKHSLPPPEHVGAVLLTRGTVVRAFSH